MNNYSISSNNSIIQNSSGGKLLKWRIGNKFIKTSTIDQTQLTPIFLYESYAEVIAYKIAKYLGFESIQYKLCRVTIDNGIDTVACECDDFRVKGEQYISIGKLMLDGRIQGLKGYGNIDDYNILTDKMLQANITSFKNKLDKTIILDSIILNDDRHYGNFGLIQGASGNMKVAPIFDNGNSLFCHKHTDQIEHYTNDLMHYIKCKPFSTDFNEQLKLVDRHTLNETAGKMEGLHSYINKSLAYMVEKQSLPANKARFISELLSQRINYICNAY